MLAVSVSTNDSQSACGGMIRSVRNRRVRFAQHLDAAVDRRQRIAQITTPTSASATR
jgi:hypothetical protein